MWKTTILVRENTKKTHSVPYAQLDRLVLDAYHFSSIIHTNSQVMDSLETLVSELQKNAGLPHTFSGSKHHFWWRHPSPASIEQTKFSDAYIHLHHQNKQWQELMLWCSSSYRKYSEEIILPKEI